MYRETLRSKEINISHHLSDRKNVRKESLRFHDADYFLNPMLRLRTEKG